MTKGTIDKGEKMKEIKFRQRIRPLGSSPAYWHYWGYTSGGTFIEPMGPMDIDPNYKESQLYLGKHDSKGQAIYEGDILKYTRFNWKQPDHPSHKGDLTHICWVWWDEESCAFRVDGKFKGGGGFGWGFPLDDDRADRVEKEVIGNIKENPEIVA